MLSGVVHACEYVSGCISDWCGVLRVSCLLSVPGERFDVRAFSLRSCCLRG